MPVILNFPRVYFGDGTDTLDATATESDILLGKTAYNASGKVEGTINTIDGGEYTPTTEDQTVAQGNNYLGSDVIVLGDVNLIAENIKAGTTIFGIEGTYEEENFSYTLLDTQGITEKDNVLATYGDIVYIYESNNDNMLDTLSTVEEYWGGTSVTNNFISDSSITTSCGIQLDNWTESNSVNTGVLFTDPIILNKDNILLDLVYYCSNWMNLTVSVHFIKSTGETTDDILTDVKTAITNESYDFTADIYCMGSISEITTNISSLDFESNTNYYMYIDGFQKASSTNFTLIKVEILNF